MQWVLVRSSIAGNGADTPKCNDHRGNRVALARKNIKTFIERSGLQYHSPHKFRHGHIHYGSAHANTIEDFKAVSMNVLHSSKEITDQFYSNLNDKEIQDRISHLGNRSEQIDVSAENIDALIGVLESLKRAGKRTKPV